MGLEVSSKGHRQQEESMSDDSFLSSLLAVKEFHDHRIPPSSYHHTQGESVCPLMENDVYYHHHRLPSGTYSFSSTRNASNLPYVDQGGEYAASDNVPPPSYDGQDFIEYSDMTTGLQGAIFVLDNDIQWPDSK